MGAGLRAILSALARGARETLDDWFVAEVWLGILEAAGPHDALRETLARWAEFDAKPLVLMIDEIDALIGDTLLAVLRQLRAGYPERPCRFPQSMILCGVRDARDYRFRSSAGNAIVAGGSAFNVRAESLRLGDFPPCEVQSLLAQHTRETGQAFTNEARAAIWELTRGQPWLVNALAYEACFKNRAGRNRGRAITDGAIQDAREQLILRRETHLDQLADKLWEERVRRVVEPLLSGAETAGAIAPDDLEYVRDLGLVTRNGPVAVANPIYREVIPRDLTWTTQEMSMHHDPVVRRQRRRAADRGTAGRVPGVLPRTLGVLGGAFPVPGGRAAVAAAGVPPAHRQRRRADRARVRPRPDANGPPAALAAARCGESAETAAVRNTRTSAANDRGELLGARGLDMALIS